MNSANIFPTDEWYPIELSHHIREEAITQAFLHGQELAIWRNRAGQVMVWENRCPHRSVRLTLGRIVDDQLACGYHGWRYGNDGACKYIPAHPSAQPPKNACVKSFPAVEQNGVIWASLETPRGEIFPVSGTFCRSYVRSCDMAKVVPTMTTAGFRQVSTNVLRASTPDGQGGSTLLITPMQTNQYAFHLWIDGTAPVERLRAENTRMKVLLDFPAPLDVVACVKQPGLPSCQLHLQTETDHDIR